MIMGFYVGWLLVGCWLVDGWLLAGCWLVAGRLLVGCWLVVGGLLVGCLVGWLFVGCSSVGAPFFWLGACLRAPAAESRLVPVAIPDCSYPISQTWLTQNRMWNPDVLLYDALGVRVERAGSWSTSPIRPVRVI